METQSLEECRKQKTLKRKMKLTFRKKTVNPETGKIATKNLLDIKNISVEIRIQYKVLK